MSLDAVKGRAHCFFLNPICAGDPYRGALTMGSAQLLTSGSSLSTCAKWTRLVRAVSDLSHVSRLSHDWRWRKTIEELNLMLVGP